MNFILQKINGTVTLDYCFQMARAKEYFDWKDGSNSFGLCYRDISEISDMDIFPMFNPEEWCPVGTIEFVEKYLRTYFGDECADNALKPLNVPECFLDNYMNTGRHIYNFVLPDNSDDELLKGDTLFYIKDNDRLKSGHNGIMTLRDAYDNGLRNVQASEIIKEEHNSSEWRAFIHNGKIVDIKNYAGCPFIFPEMEDVICSYMYQVKETLKEGTLDVYVDDYDNETYVMECHRFFSCALYGFEHNDILPIMFWRTFKELTGGHEKK